MQLNAQKFSLALAYTTSIAYIICAIVVALWPVFALQLFGWLTHLLNVEKFSGDFGLTFGGVLTGLIQAFVYSYVIGRVFVWLYNRSVQ